MSDTYTTFEEMGDFFLASITDDMFMELTIDDTKAMINEIILAAIPHFEFPRKNLFDIDLNNEQFNCKLDLEEMTIIRKYMIAEWVSLQLATIDNIRQKYSGSDFKFTSQANHMKQLQALKKQYEEEGFKLQRLYCRRKQKESGGYGSTFAKIMEEI